MRFAFAFFLSAFSSPAFAAGEIVATFSILGDWARQIAPASADVVVLSGAGQDPHAFEPRPSDLKALKAAKIVARLGLGFEPWFDRAFKASQSVAPVAIVSRNVEPIKTDGVDDPHIWQDPDLAILAVDELSRSFVAAFPGARAEVERKTSDYKARLLNLRDELKVSFNGIPRENRQAVTSHDAFAYFARAFGLTLTAPQGWSTESEPSAKQIATLIRQIKKEKVRALFVEKLTSPKVMQQISAETGVRIGGELYADALSSSSGPVPTYELFMKQNAATFQKALR